MRRASQGPAGVPHRDFRAPKPGSLACAVFLTLTGPTALAQPLHPAARIHPGTIEVGIAGASTTVDGSTRADVALRGGTFVNAGGGLAGGELEITYAHVASLEDQLRQRLGTKVQLRYAQGKGALEISFFSDGELERILEILGVRAN